MADETQTGETTTTQQTDTTAATATATAAAAATKTVDPPLQTQDKGSDKTIMEAPDDKGASSGPASWDILRKMAADGDEALEKELARHTDLKSLVKSWSEQRKELSKRQAKTDLPANATDEQKAEWRKANGIPEKPDGYKIELGDGLVVGEEDKPIVDKFLAVAHEKGWKQDQVNTALGFYYNLKAEEEAQIVQTVKAARVQTEEALRQEWGPEYRSNVNAGYTLLQQTFGKEGAALMMSARGGDNVPLGSNPDWLKGWAKLARELNPAAALMPTGTANAAGVEAEIAGYEKRMREDRDGWFKDAKAQERYQSLIEARERMQSRAA